MEIATSMINTLLPEFQAKALLAGHRLMLVISSDDDQWCLEQGLAVSTQIESSNISVISPKGLWIGNPQNAFYQQNNLEVLAASKAGQCLGTENTFVIYNAFDGFNPDGLAAISGTVTAGGLLVLITPALDTWYDYEDPDYQRMLVHPFEASAIKGNFIRWVAESLAKAEGILFWDKDNEGISGELMPTSEQTKKIALSGPCLTQEQQLAVDAIVKVATGHRRPLVITADRGRGKSSALGIASATLLQRSAIDILVTAPRFDAVQPLFKMAEELLPNAHCVDKSIHHNAGSLRFIAVDELLQSRPEAGLLLIDEAAAIPSPMLEQLLASYRRVVFSTTVHGYEGTGRGFNIRFKKILDKKAKGWRELQLSEPIRWAEGDPLERWIFDSFLLDAEVAPPESVNNIGIDACQFELCSSNRLLSEPKVLKQVFSLLVQAHYQTSPGDFRDLLDGLNLNVWILRQNETVLAVLLIAKEGGFESSLAEDIWLGKRRPRGHLLPQMLTAQAGWSNAAALSYLRIVRIAVHPALQSQGLGSYMLQRLRSWAEQQEVDFIGSSFGATADLHEFWKNNGYSSLWLGLGRDASSGSHSLLVADAISDQARDLQHSIQQRFISQLANQMVGPYADVDETLLIALLEEQTKSPLAPLAPMDLQDELDLIAYLYGHRGFEQVWSALQKLIWIGLTELEGVSSASIDKAVLMRRLVRKSWKECAESAGVSGKKQMERLMKKQLADVFQQLSLSAQAQTVLKRVEAQ